jgi:hypothetical protein
LIASMLSSQCWSSLTGPPVRMSGWCLAKLVAAPSALFGQDDAVVGKPPTAQPEFERCRLLFF